MERLPAFVIAYSDSSFTNPHEVVLPDEPPDSSGEFTHMGARYWGFETARHRATSLREDSDAFRFDDTSYHWLHLGLDAPGTVDTITVSTRWFTGNQVPAISISLIDGHNTIEVLARTPLQPDRDHQFQFEATHAEECLIRCFHEGGISRINLFGETDPQSAARQNLLRAATISHVSNEHYGTPADAVAGERQVDYMFGWESARTGFGEQALFHLDGSATIDEIIVDTYLHRLNAPLSCHVFGINEPDPSLIDEKMQMKPAWILEFDDGTQVRPESFRAYMQERRYLEEPVSNPAGFDIRMVNDQPELWHPLISFGRLRPDTWHRFRQMEFSGEVTHLLYIHYPNGGIHGLKVFGVQ